MKDLAKYNKQVGDVQCGVETWEEDDVINVTSIPGPNSSLVKTVEEGVLCFSWETSTIRKRGGLQAATHGQPVCHSKHILLGGNK